ncbi:hypothetical protein C2E23DRAFT_859495 [Lenzites betulinus]|nr:hypothetical protein C2E23DRAFT_859495 [Lenzites betulinus]
MSSSSAPDPTEAIILNYQAASLTCRNTYITCNIATSALFVYDYLLCLPRECQYVWKPGKSRASRLLYFSVRYMFLLNSIVPLGVLNPISDKVSTHIQRSVVKLYSACVDRHSGSHPDADRPCRTFVLSSKNRLLLCITMLLGLGPFLVNACTAYLSMPLNLPPPQNCVNVYNVSATLNLADRRNLEGDAKLRPRPTRELPATLAGARHVDECTLLTLSLLDLILVLLSSLSFGIGLGSYVILFLQPITSIPSCHFLLDLYETNARLECGGSSLEQSHVDLSLYFTVAGIEGAEHRDDSPFLRSLSGPVHAFPSDGDDEDDDDYSHLGAGDWGALQLKPVHAAACTRSSLDPGA